MTILISGNSQEVFSGSTNSWRDVEGKDFPSCKYIVVDMIWVSLPRMLQYCGLQKLIDRWSVFVLYVIQSAE